MKHCAALICVAAAFPLFAAVETEKDIAYALPERCKLDVKWPKGTMNFPTVVWFHGGGLTDGAECIRDAAAAVAWTLENIAKYESRLLCWPAERGSGL